jgi:hypothetical protein
LQKLFRQRQRLTVFIYLFTGACEDVDIARAHYLPLATNAERTDQGCVLVNTEDNFAII